MIDGVVGSALVPLTNVSLQPAAERGTVNVCTPELPVVCGIVDLSDKEYDVILPADVVRRSCSRFQWYQLLLLSV